ncbi:uncharacterized protein LOC126996955, partial [Eriocheir sinensis]|uniref:uncharacterized protein LOC126996955 n=1 Tax=Eriocheir sinensis TaxID=95602 RepID=UPI0021C5B83C
SSGSQGLEVNAIEGPSVVVNGSTTQLVLDCNYQLTDYDKTSLVVKWYFKRKPYPVYQWIPNNEPQDLGILKGRLNLKYEVSSDEYSKHRALAILNPTTELTGEYTCWISSFENEDFKRKKLTVYAPPSDMTLTYSKPRDDLVVITCKAGGVFPMPNMALFRSSSSARKNAIKDAKLERQHFPEHGYYNISLEVEAFDSDLDRETLFDCVLDIPGTDFEMHEELLYFKDGPPTTPIPTTTITTPSVPYEESEDAEGDEAILADNDYEKAKPQVAESGVAAQKTSVSAAGTQVVVGTLSLFSIFLVFFLNLLHH